MKCELTELKKKLAELVKDGKVDGIPVDVAMMRLSMKYSSLNTSKLQNSSKVEASIKSIKGIFDKVQGTIKEEKPKEAVPTNVEGKPTKDVDTKELKTVNGKILFKDGKTKKEVKSVAELVSITESYQSMMESLGRAIKDTDIKYVKDMFESLDKVGIKFKPVNLDLAESHLEDSARGWYKKGTISSFSNKVHEGTSPAQVVLHEYVHHVTMENLGKHSGLKDKTTALMEHVLKHAPQLKTTYAFKNEAEFLAEVVASRELQNVLQELPAYKSKSIVKQILDIFSKLLERLNDGDTTKVNALTESLELVLEVSKAGEVVETTTVETKVKETDKIAALEDRWSKLKTDAEKIAMLEELNGPMGKDGSAKYIHNDYAFAKEDWLYGVPFYKEQINVLPKGSVQYHISDGKFNKFAVAGETVGDWTFNTLGSHIGSVETVQNYEGQQSWSKGKVKYKVTANDDIKTLTMKDPGDSNWTAENMHDQLEKEYGSVPFSKDADAKEVLDFLRGKGIDAIKYENTEESGVSYMVLNPEKFTLEQIEEFPSVKQVSTKGKAQLDPAIIKQVKEAKKC